MLLVVNSTVAELEQLFDALAERMPEALVQSVLPLLEKWPALSAAAQLQKAVTTRLKGLLNTCVLDPIFDEVLPGAMRAVSATISTWCASRAPILGLVGPFKYQHDLSHLARLVGEQRVLYSRVRLPIGDK